MRQVVDDAWEEARFGGAQQEAQRIEGRRVAHEHHARRDQAPGDHDPRDPSPGADSRKDDVAGNLEGRVADEEDARPEAVHRRRKAERLVHLERGKADVNAIEIGEDVAKEEKRHQAAANFRGGGVEQGVGHASGRFEVGPAVYPMVGSRFASGFR